MIEYYGWLRILDNAYESDTSTLLNIVEDVKLIINKVNNKDKILDLKCINGRCILCVASSTNHRTQTIENVIELFKIISRKAPGSYGLLYLLDDEDKNGREDEFQVFKVAKGDFIEERDNLLSPCSGIIFD